MGIVMTGMGSDHFLGTTDVELSITGNVVVVATAVPAFGTVHIVKQLERQMLVRPGCRTMNDYKIYSSHSGRI
jgi:hypothetical protein